MANVTFEIATADEDFKAAYDIYAAAFPLKNLPVMDYVWFSEPGTVIVAKIDGKVVGYRKFRFFKEEKIVRGAGMAIDPAYQRQGIATEIIKWSFDYYKNVLGATHIEGKFAQDDPAINGVRDKSFSQDHIFIETLVAGDKKWDVYRKEL